MRRRGPRPLLLHLLPATPGTSWTGSAAGSPSWSAPPPGVDAALVHGIAAYRRHPYRRDLDDPPAVWAEGDARLLDYGAPGASGPTVLFVPSLINRAYILDLAPERSMLRFLAAAGIRPLLLDWGWPGPEERRWTLSDYVAGRLARAMGAVGGPMVLAGYCMGGLLALAAALRQPVAALALLATPWDFHAPDPAVAAHATAALGLLAPAMAGGTLPVDALAGMFAATAAGGVAAKYREFGTLDPQTERARMFVAIEDWLSDGVPLPAKVAAECLGGWYGENTPGTGRWVVDGQAVDPGALRCPVLAALPAQDRIVPPDSAAALAARLPGATVLRPAAGHIGMVAGAHARPQLWEPLLRWLRAV